MDLLLMGCCFAECVLISNRLSSLSVVRHILAASWEDPESYYREDGSLFSLLEPHGVISQAELQVILHTLTEIYFQDAFKNSRSRGNGACT
jgi:hypothetical protein